MDYARSRPAARATSLRKTHTGSRYTHPAVYTLKAAPASLHFCPTAPHDFAVASSLQVDLFSLRGLGVTPTPFRTLTRFKDVVTAACYRPDGKMLAAADAQGAAMLFDLASRAVVRTFRGHAKAAHALTFSADGTRLFTGGDDKLVVGWDVGAEAQLGELKGHADFVRTVRVSEASPHVVLSGSYDHTVKLWDSNANRCVLTLTHADPVEDVAFLRGGGVVAVANGNRVTFCDLLSGGRVLQTVVAHSKTVTSLWADDDKLLSASLDHFVKFYELQQYRVTGSVRCAAPLLAVALSPLGSHLVCGMSDNTLCVRRRASAAKAAAQPPPPQTPYTMRAAGGKPGQVALPSSTDAYLGTHPGTYRYFLRGRTHAPQSGDMRVERASAHRLSSFDKALKTFRYHEALDAALLEGSADVVVGVVEELVQRSGLRIALQGRNQTTLTPLIGFLVRNITRPPHAAVLVGVANLLLDMYAPVLGQSAAFDELFVKLRSTLEAEVALQVDLSQLMGAMDVLLAGATGSAAARAHTELPALSPRDGAAATGDA